MVWRRTSCVAGLVLGALLMMPTAGATTTASVHGGGVVGGSLGSTSQLGLTASQRGGSFLCVMAGRSGGFPFGPWQSIRQMRVEGKVSPGTLTISGDVARFEGVADIHIVGISGGSVLTVTVPGVVFVSTQGAGGAGVAWHLLELPDLGLAFGPEPILAGHIGIGP
jgi:hypothetical protein